MVPLISESDRRVPADWGQESQASSWVEAWNSACLSRCPRGERPLVALYLEPGVFSERCTEKLPPRVVFIHRVEFGRSEEHTSELQSPLKLVCRLLLEKKNMLKLCRA